MDRRIKSNLQIHQFIPNTQTSGVFSAKLMELSSVGTSFSPASLDQQLLPTKKHQHAAKSLELCHLFYT